VCQRIQLLNASVLRFNSSKESGSTLPQSAEERPRRRREERRKRGGGKRGGGRREGGRVKQIDRHIEPFGHEHAEAGDDDGCIIC
jgi:hypothetical protein